MLLPLSIFSRDHKILEQPVQSPILQRKTLTTSVVKRFARSPPAIDGRAHYPQCSFLPFTIFSANPNMIHPLVPWPSLPSSSITFFNPPPY